MYFPQLYSATASNAVYSPNPNPNYNGFAAIPGLSVTFTLNQAAMVQYYASGTYNTLVASCAVQIVFVCMCFQIALLLVPLLL